MGSLDYIRTKTKVKLLRGEHVHWIWFQSQRLQRDYVRNCVLSAPLWIKRTDFAGLEAERDRLMRVSGVIHELDHMTPVSHPLVCGLTVPWNIEVRTRADNGRKGNRWDCGNQSTLFPEIDLPPAINWEALYAYLEAKGLPCMIDG